MKVFKNLRACTFQNFLYILGVLLICVGTFQILFIDRICEHLRAKLMNINPNSKIYSRWESSNFTRYLEFYLFNWTNPQDIYNHSTKPILEEIGPFRFQEKLKKVNITWNDHNSTVTYKILSNYFFDEKNSGASLDTKITTVNLVAVAATFKERFGGFFTKKKIDLALSFYKEELHVTKTAKELLFDGYEDHLLNSATSFSFFGSDDVLPDKIGYMYKRNNSLDVAKSFNVHTGVDDMQQFGLLKGYDYKNKLNMYPDECSNIYGSAGEFFPVNYLRGHPAHFFGADTCRTLDLDFEKDVEFLGLEAYKYIGSENTMDNGTIFEENACYCEGECMPSGVINSTKCYGLPIFISFPHFLYADSFYGDQVEGMNPSREEHEFFLVMEPITGITVKASLRQQINVLLMNDFRIGIFDNIPNTYIPTIWWHYRVEIDQLTADDIKFSIELSHTLKRIGVLLTICGFIVIFILIIVNVPNNKKPRIEKSALTSNEILGSALLEKKN